MKELAIGCFLLITHIGFFIAGFSYAAKLVNKEINKWNSTT